MQLKYEKKTQAGKRGKIKRWSKQRMRKHYISAICDLWAVLIKDRDNGACQFTGRSDGQLHAHHIVFKGTLKGKLAGYFDLDNGVTLYSYEHKEAHHGEPDAYIEKRDRYLKSKGLSYKRMKEKYLMRTKFTLDDLKLIYSDFRYKAQKLRVHCDQLLKIHKRWISPMEKAGVL